MEMTTEKPRRSRDPLWDKRNFAAYSQPVPAFICSSVPQELPGWGIRNHLKTTLQKVREMENTLIPSHLAESTPLGEERKLWMYPSKQRLSSPLKHKGLVQTKTQPRSLLPTFSFRLGSKLFIPPEPNMRPYRKQLLLTGS